MFDLDDFEKINPRKNPYEPYEKQPFEEFEVEFKRFFPNFPENVIEHWAYRHFDEFCRFYWYLDFQSFRFSLTKFNLDMIRSTKTRIDDEHIFEWGDNYLFRHERGLEGTHVFKYMSDNSSWEQPVIVLDTETCPVNKREHLHYPYHLLEGHMRFAVLLAKMRNNEPVAPFHDVWLVTMEDEVSCPD